MMKQEVLVVMLKAYDFSRVRFSGKEVVRLIKEWFEMNEKNGKNDSVL